MLLLANKIGIDVAISCHGRYITVLYDMAIGILRVPFHPACDIIIIADADGYIAGNLTIELRPRNLCSMQFARYPHTHSHTLCLHCAFGRTAACNR